MGFGYPKSDEEMRRKIAAWNAASAVIGSNPAYERMDCDGRYIRWLDYGKLSQFGWEIDHIHPIALGGPDILSNLRARHWQGNRRAGARLLRAKIG